MKRRGFLATAGSAVALTVTGAGAATRKPNFLFILADDLTYSMLSMYGGRDVKTPNIERIAREGMKFNRAYSSMAMCAPFRAELYTGLYPVRNGVAWNHSSAKPGTKSVCQHLGGLGYRVGISGKVHASPKAVFPFEVLKNFPAGNDVREFMAKGKDQPFCLYICSHNSHAPWTTGDASQFDPGKLHLAPIQHDSPEIREVMTRYLAEVTDLDREVGEVFQALETSGQADNTLVMFSSEQGWALGFAKWSNWNLGVHTGLLAGWPGRIRPGGQTDAMVQMADVLPTFIDAAGGNPAEYNLDGRSFLPVLEGKKSSHRKYVYGVHNNVPEGEPYPIRSIRDEEFHYLWNLTPDASYHEKHAVTKDSRLTFWPALKKAEAAGDERAKELLKKFHNRPAEELYRVDADPYELENLADNPEYAAVKKRLRAELDRWMAEQGDTGVAMDTPKAQSANKGDKKKKAGGKKKKGKKK
ncbi:MAG: sulfatase [Kiritimatiellales bacterium]|nr:sulfatase [Kiritimatiellales bacterium]